MEVELEVDTPTALVLRDEQRATPPAGETLNKRAQRLTKTYADRNKMLNFPAVMGVVKKAIHAGHEDDQIVAALGRLAEDGRSVTTETLRIELEGLPARRSVSTTDRRVEAAQALKGTFGTDQLAIGAS